MRKSIFYLCIALCVVGCNANENDKKRNIIFVSIVPQKYFVERISGDIFEVKVMVPPGASPATYEPLPRQLNSLTEASAYFRIGHIGFEKSWMARIQSVNPRMPVFDLSHGVELITTGDTVYGDLDHEHGTDPHIWLSPKEVKIIAGNAYKALAQLDKDRNGFFYDNYREFIREVDELDGKLKRRLEPYSGYSFLIFHPSLSYIARDYNLHQFAIEWEGKEPSPGHLKDLIDRGEAENIRAVLVQEQFDMDNARAIADELGGRVVRINPLEEDWEISIIKIIDSLVRVFEEKTDKID
ncbi:MAG: zinc ABC transporter substrate-binding protein [Bacteroidales bacterium]|nr:MAG: zinc ABC transporter substrate-binding protein [Bacteroidales bacterium]